MISLSGPVGARWLPLLLFSTLLLLAPSSSGSALPTRLRGSHASVVVPDVQMATTVDTMAQHTPSGADSQAHAQRKRRLQVLPGLAHFKQQAPTQLQKELEQLGVQGQPSPFPHLSLQDVAGRRKLLAAGSTVPGLAEYAAQAGADVQQQLGQLGLLPASPAPSAPGPALQDVTARKLLQATPGDVRGLAEYAQTAPPNVQQQLALLGVIPTSPSPVASPSVSPLLSDVAARRLLLERAAPARKAKADAAVPGLEQYAQAATPQVQKQLAQLGVKPPASAATESSAAGAPSAGGPSPATIQQVVSPSAGATGTSPATIQQLVPPPAENGTRRLD